MEIPVVNPCNWESARYIVAYEGDRWAWTLNFGWLLASVLFGSSLQGVYRAFVVKLA